MDLELVETERLTAEFLRRFDGAFVLGYRPSAAGGKYFYFECTGDALVLLGAIAVICTRLVAAAERELIGPPRGEL